jgi:hypothetical protein
MRRIDYFGTLAQELGLRPPRFIPVSQYRALLRDTAIAVQPLIEVWSLHLGGKRT